MRYDLAQALMEEFADATGISGNTKPRRYLWTDAFAVCNFLGLYRQTADDRYLGFARTLVDQVHHILGRHRDDDPRRGWISGLSEDAGERHPTCGGLRIGKTLPERQAEERPDPALEWDRDGQYFHYLTKWMHALRRMAQETGETHYWRWALELLVAAHRAFTYSATSRGSKRLAWKMSIDLSRPLVSSMGHHDPLDGLVTCLELENAPERDTTYLASSDLIPVVADMTEMCGNRDWATIDPLGIGGLLDSATRLAQLILACAVDRRELLNHLLAEAARSLQAFVRTFDFNCPSEQRLAFRELGLSIGIQGIRLVQDSIGKVPESAAVGKRVLSYQLSADRIQDFWSVAAHRLNAAWTDHRDINTVMLATSLAPAGYFGAK